MTSNDGALFPLSTTPKHGEFPPQVVEIHWVFEEGSWWVEQFDFPAELNDGVQPCSGDCYDYEGTICQQCVVKDCSANGGLDEDDFKAQLTEERDTKITARIHFEWYHDGEASEEYIYLEEVLKTEHL